MAPPEKPLALITGASAGIGEAFARALAARGYDLILVARSEDRLRALAERLSREHGARADVLAADLSLPDGLARVEERARSVDLLVNNAGFGVGKGFLEADPAAHDAMIQVHVTATVRLARAALPAMVGRRRGAVVNVSSVAGFLPRAGSVTYGASKSYLTFFTQALAADLKGSGVKVQALCPGLTHTEFHQRARIATGRKPGFLWMSADAVVADSLRCLERGRVLCIPGLVNRLFVAATRLLPRALLGAAVRRTDESRIG